MWVFPKIGVPQNGWYIMENPIKMDDLGVFPLFLVQHPCGEVVCPIVGGDSHTRFPLGISFPAGSGLVAFAAATGVMPLNMPESVLVRFSGSLEACRESAYHTIIYYQYYDIYIYYIYIYYIHTSRILLEDEV